MSKIEKDNIAGKKFGKLIVIGISQIRSKNGKPMWKVRCDCGIEKDVIVYSLTSGNTTSCGCSRTEAVRKRCIKHLTVGQKFGKLTVLEAVPQYNSHRSLVWVVGCDCGKISKVGSCDLKSGHTTSCGCAFHAIGPAGNAHFNEIYSKYCYHAKERNYAWNLTKEQFRLIIKQNCFYCGVEPKQGKNMNRVSGAFIYNGIDRVNNEIGYEITNVVSCCGVCNIAKRVMTQQEFLEHVNKINEQTVSRDNLTLMSLTDDELALVNEHRMALGTVV